ncbi:methyltransferase [Magnetospirillum sp. 64-120]|uniref:tRNA1(Val) (adenine(37)-N6)-methyltransferase n=1 Tax=Magnetospirillum sp. 64-120 TaxID=1895778 RepID=UPI00092932EC|nr:methyltransferase [Magnetospirillum sp. 64-120]OJX79664.1 MAG: methyltransferase [Magnetospirillum sp. 64-120]
MPAGEDFPTTLDHFLGGRLALRQPATGYRAGSDPVFLAAATAAEAGQTVLDLGSGVGTAGLCLLSRVAGIRVTGLELQPELAGLAQANARDNGLDERYRVIQGCLTTRPAELRGVTFDHVITNPPWYEPGTIQAPSADSKAIGHLEGDADLGTWLKAAVKYLRPKGVLWVIHRADHLGRILAGLEGLKLGEIRVVPIWPKNNRAATRVLVTARKDSKAPMEILPGLVAHHDDGAYTDAAQAILKDALAWVI